VGPRLVGAHRSWTANLDRLVLCPPQLVLSHLAARRVSRILAVIVGAKVRGVPE